MTPKKYNNLVIVGSGPIGMIAALIFKEHFENIILLERQSKEVFLKKHGFTFPIVSTPASIKILKSIGIWDMICSQRSEFFGVVIHKRIAGREFRFVSAKEGVYSHWRNHAITKLYEQVVEEGIPVHFNAWVEGIDFDGNICREATLGDLPFDLLLGADGINSQTRRLMLKAHPDFDENEFGQTFLDNWYAYRLPSKGVMRENFAGGDRFLGSNVFVDNLADHPAEKFRIVTTGMRQPEEEISVQQCTVHGDGVVASGELAFLREQHPARFVADGQRRFRCLRQVETDDRLVHKRVGLVLVQLEAYAAHHCATLAVVTEGNIHAVVRQAVRFGTRYAARYAHHFAHAACFHSAEGHGELVAFAVHRSGQSVSEHTEVVHRHACARSHVHHFQAGEVHRELVALDALGAFERQREGLACFHFAVFHVELLEPEHRRLLDGTFEQYADAFLAGYMPVGAEEP